MIHAKPAGVEELPGIVQDTIDNGGVIYMVVAYNHPDGKSGSGTHTFYFGDNADPNNLYGFMRKAFKTDPHEISKFRMFERIMNDAIDDHGKPNG